MSKLMSTYEWNKQRNEALVAWKEDHFGSSEGFDAAWGTNEDFRDKDYTDPDVHFEGEY